MLGRLPGGAAPAAPLGESFCVVGYPGVGKRCLLRAMRQAKAPGAKWLCESALRLPTPPGPLGATAAAHLALRGQLPSGAGAGDALKEPVPEEAVKALLARAAPVALMRRFRLAAFEGTDAFLAAFAADREVTSRKGKAPTNDAIARHVLKELAQAPGAYCGPPAAPLEGQPDLWAACGAARPQLEAACKERSAALAGAPGGSASGGGLAVASIPNGFGPAVDLGTMLAPPEEAPAQDADMDSDDDSDLGMLGEGFEEGGEEESALEESEEEDMEADE